MEIITFEQIYDIVRKEKGSDEIQNINPEIYSQLRNYLITKEKIIKNSAGKVIKTELDKQTAQLNSAKSLSKEFFERREKKLILLALNLSRMHELNLSSLLDSEKEFVIKLAKEIENHRDASLNIIFSNEEPIEIKKNDDVPNPSLNNEKANDDKKINETEIKKTEIKEENDENYSVLETVMFTSEQHKFYGPNIEIYGPFKEGDIANLPKIIVDILLSKKKVTRIAN